jgi:hypothetical protein
MNFRHLSTWTGLIVGGTLALCTAPAHAASVSFSQFNFSTNYSSAHRDIAQISVNDIWLQSVTAGGMTFNQSDFSLVNQARIVTNDTYTGGNSGAASVDRGDRASGINQEDPTNADIVTALGNFNLNNIIDTEESGKFTMDLWFSRPIDRLLVWERGMNSKLMVQALDAMGAVLAQSELDSSKAAYAGYDLNTTEISSRQRVGAMGLALNGAVANRFRLISTGSAYNGPDFKVVGAAVPEPMTIAGTAIAAGAFVAARRKRKTAEA